MAIDATLSAGFIVDFISIPVTSGFVSASSIIIIVAQLQGLLGLKYKATNIVDSLYKLFKNIGNVRLPDLALGICSFVFLLVFRVSSAIKRIIYGSRIYITALYRLCL